MFSIENHFLLKNGERVTYRETPNKGGVIPLRWLVMHYTAGGSYSGAVSWLTNPIAKASAHLVINYDGAVTQLAPFNVKTWHAGKSFWDGVSGLNGHSVGIELVNKGYATKSGDSVISARHKNGGPKRTWEIYPTAQIEVAIEIAAELRAEYDLEDVIGHDDISPTRKVDPGPAFDMLEFRAKMYGNGDDGNVDPTDPGGVDPDSLALVVTGDIHDPLNLRRWPSMESQIIAKIPDGALVVVVRDSWGDNKSWAEVIYDNKKGWVGTRYVQFLEAQPLMANARSDVQK